MSDFLKTTLGTKPTPLSIELTPVVSNSTTIQIQLAPLPDIEITSTPEGSDWQQFNAEVSEHMITTIGNALINFANPILEDKAKSYLNENASFAVPPCLWMWTASLPP